MPRFGFKEIDVSNWLEPDFIMQAFVRMDPERGPTKMEGDDWAKAILEPRLGGGVPEDVQALFEVARGAMVYGFFFYPLYSLSGEQLFRVAEAAIGKKCSTLGAPTSTKSFASRIQWLHQRGAISDVEVASWHAARELRNIASHPERQSILTPGNAVGFVQRTAEMINALFGGA